LRKRTKFRAGLQFGFARKDNHMATLKQIEANRRNALKSTGPRTPEGKAIVSMNSLRHGLRARTIVLPNENPEEFHQLCDDLEAEWQPQSRTEQFYVEQMAVSQWKLNRMEVGEVGVFQEDVKANTQIPLLDRLWQAQCRMERSYARAQRELERLQKSRRLSSHLATQTGQAPSVSAGAPAPAAEPEPAQIAQTGQVLSPVEPAAAAPAATTPPSAEPTSNIQNPTSARPTSARPTSAVTNPPPLH
jgi:hypothetical protein